MLALAAVVCCLPVRPLMQIRSQPKSRCGSTGLGCCSCSVAVGCMSSVNWYACNSNSALHQPPVPLSSSKHALPTKTCRQAPALFVAMYVVLLWYARMFGNNNLASFGHIHAETEAGIRGTSAGASLLCVNAGDVVNYNTVMGMIMSMP